MKMPNTSFLKGVICGAILQAFASIALTVLFHLVMK